MSFCMRLMTNVMIIYCISLNFFTIWCIIIKRVKRRINDAQFQVLFFYRHVLSCSHFCLQKIFAKEDHLTMYEWTILAMDFLPVLLQRAIFIFMICLSWASNSHFTILIFAAT